ncbi:unnamed protein product [Plutella xylostella]|uniref:(diamondback moth) hypothetical protein n=1 Tax=Plutella xylostella TaxID=51655 RepID=A0A8S4G876_PLUXY|nr:unnamed protein product [Plutella xylostella]
MSSREVELTGGAPWGFRMHGGADHNQPLRIARRYSDCLERSLDVNPGRKASLSGIREGDVITSINGKPTRGITNSEAHALLRAAGPVLRLGLNEDREMSPRRRSIGKGSELKRPSQLINDTSSGRATPQAPVYSSVKQPPSPQHRLVPRGDPHRTSLCSSPSPLNSTPLVKSVAAPEESVRIHPTNPFYTTLPSNPHSSPSKLPIPNGRSTYSSLDRSKPMTTSSSEYQHEIAGLKSPTFFTKSNESPTKRSSLGKSDTHSTNGYANGVAKTTASDMKSDPFSYDSIFRETTTNGLPRKNGETSRNPFGEVKLNGDPYHKYYDNGRNENYEINKTISNSLSDNSFCSKEEIIKHSTITEHKTNEIKKVTTVKKILLNGSDEGEHKTRGNNTMPSTTAQQHDFKDRGHVGNTYESKPYNNSGADHTLGAANREQYYDTRRETKYDRNSSASPHRSAQEDHKYFASAGKFFINIVTKH